MKAPVSIGHPGAEGNGAPHARAISRTARGAGRLLLALVEDVVDAGLQ